MEPAVEDDEFFAMPRDRSHTWPMQFSSSSDSVSSSPYGSPTSSGYPSTSNLNQIQQLPSISFFGNSPQNPMTVVPQQSSNFYGVAYPVQNPGVSNGNNPDIPCDPAPSHPDNSEKPKRKRIRKKDPNHVTQKKPNPWGEESYSDLILKALQSAPEGRMKLNEIYQWFVDQVPYFRQRSGQEEASGWKVVTFCQKIKT